MLMILGTNIDTGVSIDRKYFINTNVICHINNKFQQKNNKKIVHQSIKC